VQWLRAQLDEDERIARTASWADDANAWHAKSSPFDARGAGQRWYVEDSMEDGVVSHVDPRASDDEGVARHIARHDPAHVLRDIDANRQVLAGYDKAVQAVEDLSAVRDRLHARGQDVFMTELDLESAIHRRDALGGVLRLLALPYADWPGYREEWRP
jgi:hypothetical protein